MTSYEQQVIDGVPVLVSNSAVFYYDPLTLPWSSSPKEPIRIGALTGDKLQLDADWQERVQPRIDAWRATINPVGRNEVVRAPKQSKPKRSPKSTTKATGTTVDVGTTNVVVEPEPAPKRVVKRRKAVQPTPS